MDTDTNSPRSGEQRERDRSRRGDRASRFSDIDNRDRSREKNRTESARIYVSNVPYEYRWQDLKDLFRREVGEVEFVELFADEQNKPRGCGICEFKSAESVPKALEKMNKHDLNGRQLVVKEDFGTERDKYGRVVRNNSGPHRSRGGDRGDDDRMLVGFFLIFFVDSLTNSQILGCFFFFRFDFFNGLGLQEEVVTSEVEWAAVVAVTVIMAEVITIMIMEITILMV